MKRKILTVLLCCALTMAALTGCGDTGADAATASGPQSQQPSPGQEDSEEQEGAGRQENAEEEEGAGQRETPAASEGGTSGDERVGADENDGADESEQVLGEETQKAENNMADIEITMRDISPKYTGCRGGRCGCERGDGLGKPQDYSGNDGFDY